MNISIHSYGTLILRKHCFYEAFCSIDFKQVLNCPNFVTDLNCPNFVTDYVTMSDDFEPSLFKSTSNKSTHTFNYPVYALLLGL